MAFLSLKRSTAGVRCTNVQNVKGYAPAYLSSFISKRSDVHCYNTRQRVNLSLPSVKQPPLNALFSVSTQETVNPWPVLSAMLM